MQDLLELAFDDPAAAARLATGVLSSSEDPLEHSYAYQALGITHREAGHLDQALDHLRSALEAAKKSRVDDRLRDVRATYGGTLVVAGSTDAGLRQLSLAKRGASGETGARVKVRHAAVLAMLGRHREAVLIINDALEAIVGAGDRGWEARTRIWLAHVEARLGHLDAAEGQVREAEQAFRETGGGPERLTALENLAEIALSRGNLARSLSLFADASSGHKQAGRSEKPDVVGVRATVYLAAGLADEAVELLDTFAEATPLSALEEAEIHLRRALALMAASNPSGAYTAARSATALFRRQHRDWFLTRARFVAVRASSALGKRAIRESRAVAVELDRQGADEAPLALILAGRLARGHDRLTLWRQAASYKNRANGLVRASANLAGALEREEMGDRGGVLRACSAGLDAIDEHRRLMGSSELRALATTHGRELTEVALRHAAHDPRTLLRWSERTRATALAQPPVTADVATIPAPLAALRDNGRRLAEARQAGEPTEDLEKERLRLERAVRAEHHSQSAADADPQRPARVDEIVAGVGDGCLVELIDVDGNLHVLVVHHGRVRRKVAGTTSQVADLLGPAGMLLRRAARGRPANTADIGRRLQEAILGDAARLLPDGPVTLAPTARLHGLAWSLLPTLHDRPFGIVPSAGQWLRATNAQRPDPQRTVLVVGPELESGGAEVPVLAQRHPDAALLDGQAATLAAVLDALDGADLVHLATHGRFRADSPLFSALDLADGPLTVHDLERLRSAPYRVVLSACESGVLAPVGAQELLGLAAALFSIGTAGLVSSVGEVNDAATADLMVGLHDGLAAGRDPAAALLDVRRAAAGDPVAAGTAAAFVALGV
jgi:tetratricopeptide (TPR) repeat protein